MGGVGKQQPDIQMRRVSSRRSRSGFPLSLPGRSQSGLNPQIAGGPVPGPPESTPEDAVPANFPCASGGVSECAYVRAPGAVLVDPDRLRWHPPREGWFALGGRV